MPYLATLVPDELLTNFMTFYTQLLNPDFAGSHLKELLASRLRDGSFFFCDAQTCFIEGQRICKANHSTSSEKETRAKRLAAYARNILGIKAPTKANFKRQFLREEALLFQRIYRQYFMIDIYPENAIRFPNDLILPEFKKN